MIKGRDKGKDIKARRKSTVKLTDVDRRTRRAESEAGHPRTNILVRAEPLPRRSIKKRETKQEKIF